MSTKGGWAAQPFTPIYSHGGGRGSGSGRRLGAHSGGGGDELPPVRRQRLVWVRPPEGLSLGPDTPWLGPTAPGPSCGGPDHLPSPPPPLPSPALSPPWGVGYPLGLTKGPAPSPPISSSTISLPRSSSPLPSPPPQGPPPRSPPSVWLRKYTDVGIFATHNVFCG